MATHFTLTRRTNPNAGPAALQEIDNELCAALGIAPSPGSYYHQWVDTIGRALTAGQSFNEIIEDCREASEVQSNIDNHEGISYWTTKLKIAEYLNQHYVSEASAQIGRR